MNSQCLIRMKRWSVSVSQLAYANHAKAHELAVIVQGPSFARLRHANEVCSLGHFGSRCSALLARCWTLNGHELARASLVQEPL
jgi:hypothetical protein